MARRRARNRVEDDSDPSFIAAEAPKRIYELKKERDERVKGVVAEAEEELASVRQQMLEFKEERRRECCGRRALNLKKVRDLVEQRRTIEMRMLDVVAGVHSEMKQVEEMILAGYEGRRGEARQALGALGGETMRGDG